MERVMRLFRQFGKAVFKRTTLATLLLPGCFILPPSSLAQESIGKTVRVENQVSASIGDRALKPQDAVFASEIIEAGTASHGEILLNDDSKVLVGENSRVSLDDFVVGGKGFESGAIKVTKGAFRFITGNSKKGFLNVETPLSTIGVRGTLFDVYVADTGDTRVVLFKGAVEVCSSSNCIFTDKACDIIEVTGNGAQGLPYLRAGDREEEDRAYSLTDLQKRFQTSWRAPLRPCAVRAFFDPKHPSKLKRKKPIRKDFDGGSPCSHLKMPVWKDGILLAQTSPVGPTGTPGTDAPC